MSKPTNRIKSAPSRVIGVGLDSDGEHRITRIEDDITLVGGSKDTHDIMTEHGMKFREALKRRGKRVSDLGHDEFRDLMQETDPTT